MGGNKSWMRKRKRCFKPYFPGMDGLEEKINQKIETEIRGVKVLVENDVGKRIDSLFDGYKLAHENNGN